MLSRNPTLLPSQVKLNRGLDFVQLDDLLIDLKLTPDVLEVPVPRCFIEDRAQVGCSGWEHGGDPLPAAALWQQRSQLRF